VIVPIDDRERVEMRLSLMGFSPVAHSGEAVRYVNRQKCIIDLSADRLHLIFGPSTILSMLGVGCGSAVANNDRG
jgi:hypothetical protein